MWHSLLFWRHFYYYYSVIDNYSELSVRKYCPIKFGNKISQQNFHMLRTKMMDIILQFPIKTVLQLSLISSLGACTFRSMILHQRPLRTINVILSLTQSIIFMFLCSVHCNIHKNYLTKKSTFPKLKFQFLIFRVS
jgi:hypothetical protein